MFSTPLNKSKFIVARFQKWSVPGFGPLFVLFGIVDFIYSPANAPRWLVYRLSFAIYALICSKLVRKAAFRKKFATALAISLIVYGSLTIDLMIIEDGGARSSYPEGLLLVVLPGIAIFRLNQIESFVTCVLCFLPTLLIIWTTNTSDTTRASFLHTAYLVTLVVVLWVFRSSEKDLEVKYTRRSSRLEALHAKMKREQYIRELERLETDRLNGIRRQAAHDIAAPLFALKVISNSEEVNASTKELIQIAVERTLRIIKDFNIKSDKLEDIKTALESGWIDIKSVVRAIIKETRLATRNPIIFSESVSSNSNTLIYGDQSSIERSISNILRNAIEASSPQDQAVHVSMLDQNDTIILEIKDFGIGMPPDVVSQIGFKGVSFGKPNGNGLGLYFAKETMKTVGGQLKISSFEGRGTTVSLIFTHKRAAI